MSELFPLPRSVREHDFEASAAQTEFGPPDWTLFDEEDVLVYVKPAGGSVFGLVDAADYTVDPLDPGFPSKFRIVFAAGRAAGDVVRIKGARAHERLTNVTQAGAIRAVPLETELDRIGVVLQELRRDNDRSVNLLTDAENAAAVAEAARDAALDAQAGAEAAETGSEDARDASFAWASENEDIPVDDGVNPVGFSAFHWSRKALDGRDFAFAWASEGEDIPVDDGANPAGFSAFHWSEKASASAVAAAASAAGLNLPPIQAGDAGKLLFVNQAEDGYELRTDPLSDAAKLHYLQAAFGI